MQKKAGRRVILPSGGLGALLERMASAGSGDRVTLGEITEALGPAGLGGAILVPALIALSPATVIFGVATVCGLAIAVIAAQIMWNAPKLWLPAVICRLSIRRAAIVWLRDRLSGPFSWLESHSKPRLTVIIRAPLGHVPGAVTFALGLSMPFLELVPLSATTGGAAITLMVLGLLLDDGILVAAGLLASAGVLALIITLGGGVLALVGA